MSVRARLSLRSRLCLCQFSYSIFTRNFFSSSSSSYNSSQKYDFVFQTRVLAGSLALCASAYLLCRHSVVERARYIMNNIVMIWKETASQNKLEREKKKVKRKTFDVTRYDALIELLFLFYRRLSFISLPPPSPPPSSSSAPPPVAGVSPFTVSFWVL